MSLLETIDDAPLAERLRPADMDAFVGQAHLVGPGGALRDGPLRSCLLWGPPGCGKTTLARLLAGREAAAWVAMSPVSAGVRDLRECVGAAEERRASANQRTVLFVDEVHRFNKSQQDYFLPHVESGLLTFIGATTENPSFEINSALLSRLVVFRLDPLAEADLRKLLDQAVTQCAVELTAGAAQLLLQDADGDARRMLNLVERLATEGGRIDEDGVARLASARLRRFDKRGDDFYDQISAMIKSVRGSDPDAALYWLCRMLDGGADPRYLSRRIIRLATEDIGMADPNALRMALAGDEHFRRLGTPEGELGIAQALIYLACAPKSNAAYEAYKSMSRHVQEHGSAPVPRHLRNAPTKLLKDQGNAAGYRYAHDEPHGYAAGASYWPDGMRPVRSYVPTGRGFEGKVAERLKFLRGLDQAHGRPAAR